MDYDTYLQNDPRDCRENDLLTETYERYMGDQEEVNDLMIDVNKKHPCFLLECFIEAVDPTKTDLFEEAMEERCKEFIEEY